jgi:hypothetical protein
MVSSKLHLGLSNCLNSSRSPTTILRSRLVSATPRKQHPFEKPLRITNNKQTS